MFRAMKLDIGITYFSKAMRQNQDKSVKLGQITVSITDNIFNLLIDFFRYQTDDRQGHLGHI